jgi:hypothetical protein
MPRSKLSRKRPALLQGMSPAELADEIRRCEAQEKTLKGRYAKARHGWRIAKEEAMAVFEEKTGRTFEL